MATSVSAKLSRLGATIREKGFREALRLVTYRLHEEVTELRLGIRTSGLVTETALGHENPDFLSYSGAPYRALQYCLTRVTISPGRDALLDVGCGMGRAMIVAATRPFRRVLGVEISAALAERARDNLRRARRHLKCETQVEVADARWFPVPDDITMVHLFNPFLGETLAQVVGNLKASLARRPRELTIIYGNPGTFEGKFLHEGWLEKRLARSFYPGIGYAIYRSSPGHRTP